MAEDIRELQKVLSLSKKRKKFVISESMIMTKDKIKR